MDASLLQPSLKGRSAEAGFSQQASFFVGFFGGGIAALLFTAWNVSLWRRVRQDLPLLIVVGLAVVAAVFFHARAMAEMAASGQEPAWWLSRGMPRALGIAAWAVFAVRHRALFKAQELSDMKPRSPWLPAIGCVLMALGASLLLAVAARGSLG